MAPGRMFGQNGRHRMKLIDLHCHILPYVDDGATNMDEAIALLQLEAEQGITDICLTPHLRSDMFRTTDEKVKEMFARLRDAAAEEQIPVKLYLSREYYYDDSFLKRMDAGQMITIANSGTILTEFSYHSSEETLLTASRRIREAGYSPLFAHVERYEAVHHNPELIPELIDMGTMIQVNSSSILGLDGWGTKRLAWNLMKNGNVHVVASDAHDIRYRIPNLGRCAVKLEKKLGAAYAEAVLCRNPMQILNGLPEE